MKKIKLFYYKDEPNFGDKLSIFIAQKLYDAVNYAPRKRCNAVFVGSLIEYFFSQRPFLWRMLWSLLSPPVLMWGTGFMRAEGSLVGELMRRFDVRACRGFLTLERLKKMRGVKIAKDIVVADPGLLAGRLIDTSDIEKKYELGIIPHYVDKNNPLLKKIKIENSVMIDIQQQPEIFMKKLAECKYVIASAMHGLIAADSLGIPNVRMVLSDKIIGGDYKYNDYYSAFGLDSHVIINLSEREFSDADLPDITNSYKVKPEQVVQLQDALLNAFPFQRK